MTSATRRAPGAIEPSTTATPRQQWPARAVRPSPTCRKVRSITRDQASRTALTSWPDGAPFYNRPGPTPLHGTQPLKYYVGSNTRGRTFLFDIEGFLYQSPINYFAARDRWDMSPGYSQLVEMELNHPVDSTCLFCHASRVQPAMEGSVNQFAGEAFLQPGVGCERCHGPGSDHVRGLGPMVNPGKLTGDRRDSICNQCHLEGEARIASAGRTQDDYTPGDRLADYLAVFVRADAASDRLGAVSHVEALALSKCKRESGEKLSCITCLRSSRAAGERGENELLPSPVSRLPCATGTESSSGAAGLHVLPHAATGERGHRPYHGHGSPHRAGGKSDCSSWVL